MKEVKLNVSMADRPFQSSTQNSGLVMYKSILIITPLAFCIETGGQNGQKSQSWAPTQYKPGKAKRN